MKSILLVEDDDALRGLLAKVLRRGGFEVLEATNGIEAETKLETTKVDLILSDLLMPGKDGIELLMDLRGKYSHLKIVAMSGGGHTGTGTYLNVAKALGANRTLVKPFENQEMLDLIHKELSA